MMQLVAGQDVRDRPHADLVPARDAAPAPSLPVEPLEKVEAAAPHCPVFLDQAAPVAAVEARGGDVVVLLEPFERRPVGARESQRPVCEDPLRIRKVPHHLAQAPLSLGVPTQRIGVRNRAQLRDRPVNLRPQSAQHIARRNEVDIPAEIGRVLARVRLFNQKVCHRPYVTLRGNSSPQCNQSQSKKNQSKKSQSKKNSKNSSRLWPACALPAAVPGTANRPS